jgi:hypothetical protein
MSVIVATAVTLAVLIAPSAQAAEACPNSAARTGPAASLPDCRAYELVSPLRKNGVAVKEASVLDGSHVLLSTSGSIFSEDPGASAGAYYLTSRTSTGWQSRTSMASGTSSVVGFVPDLSRAIIEDRETLVAADGDGLGESGMEDVFEFTLSDASARLLSTGSLGASGQAIAAYRSQSFDATHVVFATNEQLEPEDDTTSSATSQLYERVGATTRMVGFLPDGSASLGGVAIAGDTGRSGIGAGGGAIGADGMFAGGQQGAVSADGSRIFFESPDPQAFTFDSQLYVRIDGQTTVHVSAPQRSTPLIEPYGVRFQGASADGTRVFFTTPAPLVDGDADGVNDLYRYDVPSGDLTLVSGGQAGAGMGACPSSYFGVGGVCGGAAVSSDGSHVYFIATGALTPAASPGSLNLYAYDADLAAIRLIGELADAALSMTGLGSAPPRVSLGHDGETFVFQTSARLTAFDNNGFDEVYRYDASTDETVCVSCPVTSGPATGNAELPVEQTAWGSSASKSNRLVSQGGNEIAFQTREALASQDRNGRIDAYLWQNGVVSLISSGKDSDDVYLAGMTQDGREVFFASSDRLVSQDTDSLRDLYVARVNGGFALPAVAIPCRDDVCQGEQSGRPALREAGSLSLLGPGDALPRPRAAFSVGRLSTSQRARLARGSKVAIKVRVNRAGRVSAIGRARIGTTMRTVAAGVKTAHGAGTVVLPLKLSAPARHELAGKRALGVVLRVTFAGALEPRTLKLSLVRHRSERTVAAR